MVLLQVLAPLSRQEQTQCTTPAPKLVQAPKIVPTQGLGPQDASSALQHGEVPTLKSNTIVQSFGPFWKERDSGEIHMMPCSTNVTVVANVQLEFLEYCDKSVKIKPKLDF